MRIFLLAFIKANNVYLTRFPLFRILYIHDCHTSGNERYFIATRSLLCIWCGARARKITSPYERTLSPREAIRGSINRPGGTR